MCCLIMHISETLRIRLLNAVFNYGFPVVQYAGNVLVFGAVSPNDGDWFGGVMPSDADDFFTALTEIEVTDPA